MKYFIVLCLVLAVCEAGVHRSIPSDTYIVGGGPAASGEIPYIVSLGHPSHFCGGSIINARTILTAAHCMDGEVASQVKVRVGSLAPNSGGTQVGVSRIVSHGGYNANNDNDIALLILSSDIPLNGKTIAPVNLPASDSDPASRQTVLIAGWGRIRSGGALPSELLKVNVNIVDRATCKKQYTYTPYDINDLMICAGVDAGGKDTCQGDSGGPLTQGNTQLGVVSFGIGCADKDYAGVYTRVSKYINWINLNKA